MKKSNQRLSHRVCKLIKKMENNKMNELSPELLEAMRLADLYEFVRPIEYTLPLDALAGFWTMNKIK